MAFVRAVFLFLGGPFPRPAMTSQPGFAPPGAFWPGGVE